jgi:hypothetical protein
VVLGPKFGTRHVQKFVRVPESLGKTNHFLGEACTEHSDIRCKGPSILRFAESTRDPRTFSLPKVVTVVQELVRHLDRLLNMGDGMARCFEARTPFNPNALVYKVLVMHLICEVTQEL